MSLFTPTINATQVNVIDKTLNPASNFLAYTEFELSGEPLAEALGLDLDMLDPTIAASPTAFDFAAGIESYEYSEEAMYALNYQSTMGIHLINGPTNKARGGSSKHLSIRINEMAKAVGFDSNAIPKNMYPLAIPFAAGNPEIAQQIDNSLSKGEVLEIVTARGNEKTITSQIPAYLSDYKTLAWRDASFDKSFNPAAIGGILLKEVMWSQDFLGGMHITATDEEVEAESATMDQDGKHSLGVSAADGFNGMLLTEMSIDKLLIMQEQLGFDGKSLGVKITPNYDPKNGAIWFPHKVAVSVNQHNQANAIASLSITNKASTLRDTWQMLWPLAEFYAFTDQRLANTGQNPAMLATFDGTPFAAAPRVNTDNINTNDTAGTDAFSLANNLSNFVFKNIAALHFNEKQGTFVDLYDGKQSSEITTYDAAYSIVSLAIYQRAKDALPVGYASADSGAVNLATTEGKQAISMLSAQANFIIKHLINDKGLVFDSVNIATNTPAITTSLDSQFAAIRGLVAAYLATNDNQYKKAARKIYLAVEKHMFDKSINTWATAPGRATIHTPYTEAAISGGLRETILHLKNEEGEHEPALELQALTNRYVSWFNGVINGGMQLAEPIGDTGEVVVKGSQSTDTDEDNVHQIIAAGGKYGTATTMANSASVSAEK